MLPRKMQPGGDRCQPQGHTQTVHSMKAPSQPDLLCESWGKPGVGNAGLEGSHVSPGVAGGPLLEKPSNQPTLHAGCAHTQESMHTVFWPQLGPRAHFPHWSTPYLLPDTATRGPPCSSPDSEWPWGEEHREFLQGPGVRMSVRASVGRRLLPAGI